MAPEKRILVTLSLRERKITQRLISLKVDFKLEYSIKDAGFEILIEVGVKGLDDVYTLKKLQFNRSPFALRIIIKEKRIQTLP